MSRTVEIRIECSVCGALLDGEHDVTGVLKIDPCENCAPEAAGICWPRGVVEVRVPDAVAEGDE